MALRSPPPPRLAPERPGQLCATLDAITALAFQGVSLPPDPTPEDVRAVRAVNAQLGQLAETVRSIQASKEAGCHG